VANKKHVLQQKSQTKEKRKVAEVKNVDEVVGVMPSPTPTPQPPLQRLQPLQPPPRPTSVLEGLTTIAPTHSNYCLNFNNIFVSSKHFNLTFFRLFNAHCT